MWQNRGAIAEAAKARPNSMIEPSFQHRNVLSPNPKPYILDYDPAMRVRPCYVGGKDILDNFDLVFPSTPKVCRIIALYRFGGHYCAYFWGFRLPLCPGSGPRASVMAPVN